MNVTARIKTDKKTLQQLDALQRGWRAFSSAPVNKRDQVLLELLNLLRAEEKKILDANSADMRALPKTATDAFRDRLTLNVARLRQIEASLQAIVRTPDPLAAGNEQAATKLLSNGLKLRKVPAPFGVIYLIFESRPNVAIESFGLALKSGNAILLKGGKEAKRTLEVFYKLIRQALERGGFDESFFWGLSDAPRPLTKLLLTADRHIDLVIPRGGSELIRFVVQHSRVPVLKNDRGMCHVYVEADADLEMAAEIVENGKCQRPGVCNSTETLLVHEAVAAQLLPRLFARTTSRYGLQWRACPASYKLLEAEALKTKESKKLLRKATAKDFDTEYLDFILNCKVVSSREEAQEHIREYGSRHSEAIVTRAEAAARSFQREVDAAVVYWNASTRFTDGFEFGLGGEVGISTQKLHVRGPVGLSELTNERWVVDGKGQIRS